MAHTFSNPCTAADLVYVAPVFGSGGASPVAEERLEAFLELAEACTDRDLFGTEKAPWAVCYLAAHLAFEDVAANAQNPASSSQGYAGPVTSEAVGPVSRSYGGGGASSSAYSAEALATTPWGKKLIQLRNTVFARGVF